MNHLCKGDMVKVKPDLGPAFSEELFPRNCVAIVVTVFGRSGSDTEFKVYVKGKGEVRGYKREHLEFLDQNHEATLELWKKLDKVS